MLRCIEHRHNADVDQTFLPEDRIAADRDDLVVQFLMTSFDVPVGATNPK